MTIHRLAYVSRPSPEIDPEAVRAIAEAARERNRDLEVTGLLVHEFGRFIQLLEGPIASLEELMVDIIRDPRHSDIRIFLQQSGAERTMERWLLLSDFDRSATTPGELEVREEIVRAALASLAELDYERRQAAMKE
ncbi:BLUF domain-containing protein [Jiella marina]|uniref:BLUF domain-containing protein n=1 Tax=Jiella sp. LLJ827 TaxID=2917712 RepID=UPI002100E26C|nr:BLUF domain-containing protein [Jiella sp. LLJ827]MCQ0989667.1 BLUF domain-containing protein [Jiella sp. LLJ827]